MRLLSFLLDIFFPPRERALRARSVSHQGLAPLIEPVRIASVSPTAVSLLPYRNALVQAAVTEAKFNGARHAQDALGAVLGDYLCTLDSERTRVLIPVPLSRERYAERGYNQAERICRAAIRTMPEGISIDTGLLRRIRDTPPQTGLGSRARRANLEGAFGAARPPDPHTLYIVVDDVITTGTTLSAATCALRAAGAIYLRPVALAHSP